ncbi:asparagine synthase (glutamine-hydrolyzing) [soil metagenome]
MCGLLFRFNKNKFKREDLPSILNSLQLIKHRGPDGEGILFLDSATGNRWVLKSKETPDGIVCDGELSDFPEGVFDVCMAHRRLSIFDLTIAGHQPFNDAQGNLIIFNGEIYNFSEIKSELERSGISFRTKSDTEVILAAYCKWGELMLDKFNGMFSIIIWDNQHKRFFIVNDRHGVKPLYYFQNQESITFVSELKQFSAFGIFDGFNWEKIGDFLRYGFIDHDYETLLRNIYRFPNSHFTYYLAGKEISPKSYYTIPPGAISRMEEDEINGFPSVFNEAVSLRLRADVPWGIGASGGLDSSIVLYTADRIQKQKELQFRVKTFSAIFPGYKEDESEFIRFIENDLAIDSYYTNPIESFSAEDFRKHIWHIEAPIMTTAYYSQWDVARLAKQNGVTVLLVGQGADELFGGYHHHFYRYCRFLLGKMRFGKLSSEIKCYAEIKNIPVEKLRSIVINEFKLKLRNDFGFFKNRNPVYTEKVAGADPDQLLRLDFQHVMLPFYLRADDRASMAFSLETRHPFLDRNVVDFGFRLPMKYKIENGWQKKILREKFDFVPEKLRFRKDKKGFATPMEVVSGRLNELGNIPEELRAFCKKNGIEKNENDIDLRSLAVWMNFYSNAGADSLSVLSK